MVHPTKRTVCHQSCDAGLASIFNVATPLFTIVLAGVLLGDERLSLPRLLGVLIGLRRRDRRGGGGIHGGGKPASLLAMVGAVSSFAVTAVWTRRFLRGARSLAIRPPRMS